MKDLEKFDDDAAQLLPDVQLFDGLASNGRYPFTTRNYNQLILLFLRPDLFEEENSVIVVSESKSADKSVVISSSTTLSSFSANSEGLVSSSYSDSKRADTSSTVYSEKTNHQSHSSIAPPTTTSTSTASFPPPLNEQAQDDSRSALPSSICMRLIVQDVKSITDYRVKQLRCIQQELSDVSVKARGASSSSSAHAAKSGLADRKKEPAVLMVELMDDW